MAALNHAGLKTKQRQLREGFPTNVGLRVHRAISWVGRSEEAGTDSDAAFIFLWIAFNAAYASARMSPQLGVSERSAYADYFRQMVTLDTDRRIYDAIWTRFSGPIRNLLDNRYVFHPFWQHHNGVPDHENWQERFDRARQNAHTALKERDTTKILGLVFDRLYVLRNQLVHGGATWGGAVNRQQVKDGAAILGLLLPVFIDLMMNNPEQDWGEPHYPVIED